MKLWTKFNLALLVVFMISLAVTGVISYEMLRQNARDAVIRNAEVMMEAAASMRSYMVEQIKPLLEMQLRRAFFPNPFPPLAPPSSLAPYGSSTRIIRIKKPP